MIQSGIRPYYHDLDGMIRGCAIRCKDNYLCRTHGLAKVGQLDDGRRRPGWHFSKSSHVSGFEFYDAKRMRNNVYSASVEGGLYGGNEENEISEQKNISQSTQSCTDQSGGPEDTDARALVEKALQKAQEAMEAAQKTSQNVKELPSARLPSPFEPVINALKPFVQLGLIFGFCYATHSLGTWARISGGFLMAVAVGIRGYRKSSLSASGSLAAVGIGFATLSSSFRSGIILLSFFFLSSAFTRLGEEEKSDIDDQHRKGGQRDWVQVFCNGFVPATLSTIGAIATGYIDYPLWILNHGLDVQGMILSSLSPDVRIKIVTAIQGAIIGYFACCCGDTWASELGQLSEEEPRLITSLRPVRKGTNGGVTLTGLAASVAGGLAMGTIFYIGSILSPSAVAQVAMQQWQVIFLGIFGGLIGSLIDSVLGATVQFTGFNRRTGKVTGQSRDPDVTRISGVAILDNNGVNVVSATLTSFLVSFLAIRLYPMLF